MIRLKNSEEIELLRENAILVSKTLAEVGKIVAPGVTTMELNNLADTFIRDNGAIPSFLNYEGFPYSICVSVNDTVVHGFPSNYRLKEGDIVSIDCGTLYKGYNGDSAYTFAVGEVDADTRRLLDATEKSLYLGIEQAVAGKRIGDIGNAIQTYCEAQGLSVVREMVGHGIGKGMHESPEVPNYGYAGQGKKLVEGMVLCIEPMINLGTRHIYLAPDNWGIKTEDGRKSAHFEMTVAVKHGKADVLTTYEFINDLKK
ncbi:MAG: type I methionyl aminopeptidase [Candidatus Egerieousia sp.]|jgi:methionyl aminopeptidase|nr:type I methionyl aminopeptidase [Bacteroidales bacterium]MCI6917584.1 type I methionyl aminopeptidase [bacterium]MDY2650885.1 type I methionyl aminopeptidase [Candidatus Egerieousia sp.]MDD7071572.1 type I methionyl aminopeptidase [bacterium]MDD7236848.1 type I methionyl aminopeptidase [bacterium]